MGEARISYLGPCFRTGTLDQDVSKEAFVLTKFAESEGMPVCQLKDEFHEFFSLLQDDSPMNRRSPPDPELTDLLIRALEEAEEYEKRMLITLYIGPLGDDGLVAVSCMDMVGSEVASLRKHSGFVVKDLRAEIASQLPRRFQLLLPTGRALTQEDDGLSLEQVAGESDTVGGQVKSAT